MPYEAKATVVLRNGDTQTVTARGDSRIEALENLENNAAGINVVAVVPSSIETYVVRNPPAGREAWNSRI